MIYDIVKFWTKNHLSCYIFLLGLIKGQLIKEKLIYNYLKELNLSQKESLRNLSKHISYGNPKFWEHLAL